MGYYNQSDLPSPYWFATQFATSDRWYNPEPAQTEDTRLYAMAATSQGLVHPPQDTNTQLTAKTIFQLLDAAGISWKIYSVDRQPDGKLITTSAELPALRRHQGRPHRSHLSVPDGRAEQYSAGIFVH